MTVTIGSRITAGVDTHLDVHVVAALDERGGLLGVESFETTAAGYRSLVGWLKGVGEVELVGVEGTVDRFAQHLDRDREIALAKPWSRDGLLTKVREVLDA